MSKLLNKTRHETLTNARLYTPTRSPVPILLLWRFKGQRELENQLSVNVLWFFGTEMAPDWSCVLCQTTGAYHSRFPALLASPPSSPTPGICSIAFSSLLDTYIYICVYVCVDKRDFCSVGQLFKEAINGKTHLSPLVLHHPYISKQFNGVFCVYLLCSFII